MDQSRDRQPSASDERRALSQSGNEIQDRIDAVWRIDGANVVATIARMVGDVGLAEDLAQDAITDALTSWPRSGTPRNPAAWLTTVAKRKAIDNWRRRERLDKRHRAIAHELETQSDDHWDPLDDDVLKLIFTACHPVLGREAQVALTLRVVGGLNSEEIARMFLVSVPTIQQRIVRAKKTLASADIPFEVPEPEHWDERLGSVLSTLYLIFTEGYAATSGDRWIRSDLASEALRLGRVLAELVPREAEVHGLVALMEFQASRFAARVTADGSPVLLADQDRTRWDHSQIRRGSRALARADSLGHGRGNYALQAAIAQCHATAADVDTTDWNRIVELYHALAELTPNPVVELNRAVAVSKIKGPEAALKIVDELADSASIADSHLLPSVRGELLAQLGRREAAKLQLEAAAHLCGNTRERQVLLDKAAAM